MLRLLALALVAGVAATGLVGADPGERAAAGATPTAPPNVLVFLTDDQRADTMSVMPKTRKWFWQGGTRYPNAFVTTPLCCPSRGTIFTGQYAHNHGVTGNVDGAWLDQGRTLQRYLQDEGYRTGFVGKYLNAWLLHLAPPHFHRWSMFNGGYTKRRFNIDGVVRTVDEYSTRFVAKRAIRTLRAFERNDEVPWLLYVSTAAPHSPWEPETKYAKARVPRWERNPAQRETDRTDKPPTVQGELHPPAAARFIRKQQLRMLMSVDDLVGNVMKELGTLGERRDTLAFFVSDNGFLWGDHGLSSKRHPYTGSIRVPMAVRWPGRIGAGAVDGRIAANTDIFPTVRDAVGFPLQHEPDGRSLLGGDSRDRLLGEYWFALQDPPVSAPRWAALRTSTLQYTEYFGEEGGVVFREYYDLGEDPWQLENLLGDPDPTNDPSPSEQMWLSLRLSRDRQCHGTEGEASCP